MGLVDINGNVIETGGSVSSSDIKTALIGAIADGTVNLGSAIGATLAYNGFSTAWESYANNAYQSLLEKYKTMPNSGVPFFASTDQHGGGLEQHRWLNNTDVDGMNIASINLGDTVSDYYNTSQLEDILTRTKQVKNFIGVVGNHDKMYKNYEKVTDYLINKCFITTYADKKTKETENCYVAFDTKHSVKYVVLDTFIVNEDGTGFEWGITFNTAEWLIGELSLNDGYDVVFLCHYPLFVKDMTRDDEAEATTQGTTAFENSNSIYKTSIWNMLIGRKNKTTGTLIDVNGIEHSYDFSSCKNELLCELAGHIHEEKYSVSDGFTCYGVDWHGNNDSCVFGLMDRENSKMYIWKFDSTQAYDVLELPI